MGRPKIYEDKKESDHVNRRRWLHGNDKIIETIYERDNGRCTQCGIAEGDHKKIKDKTGRSRSLILHHTNLDKKDHSTENQKLLCTECRNKTHGVLTRLNFKNGGKFRLHREVFLRCAHNLRDGYPHNCKNVHGEYYRIRMWIEGRVLDKYGVLVDFKDLKKWLADKYDHRYLNEIPPFDKINPTAENIVQHLFIELNLSFSKLITRPKLVQLRVYESDTSYIEMSEG